MELKSSDASSWTCGQTPSRLSDPSLRAVMLFGPDQGGVSEFSCLAAKARGDFQIISANSAKFGEIAPRLVSGSLFAPAVGIRLDGATDKHAGLVSDLLDLPFAHGASLIVAAGELRPNSKLRSLFKDRRDVLSAPLYMMREKDSIEFAERAFSASNLGFRGPARRALASRLSGDRALASRACELVALHALARKTSQVEEIDITAVLDDVDERSLSAPIDLALLGRPGDASLAVSRRLDAGESFVGMLRAFSFRLFKLREMASWGISPDQAFSKAKMFFGDRETVTRILSLHHGVTDFDHALGMVDATERLVIEKRIPPRVAMPAAVLDVAMRSKQKD